MVGGPAGDLVVDEGAERAALPSALAMSRAMSLARSCTAPLDLDERRDVVVDRAQPTAGSSAHVAEDARRDGHAPPGRTAGDRLRWRGSSSGARPRRRRRRPATAGSRRAVAEHLVEPPPVGDEDGPERPGRRPRSARRSASATVRLDLGPWRVAGAAVETGTMRSAATPCSRSAVDGADQAVEALEPGRADDDHDVGLRRRRCGP